MQHNLRLLAWFNFLLDLRLYGPFAIIYFAQVSGSYALGMAVFALTQLVSALMEVPTGVLSDQLGRRATLILGAFFSVLAVVSYAAAPGAMVLMLGGALEGLSRALFSGNNAAMLFDTLAEEAEESTYHHHFGRMGSMMQLGLASGALLGGLAGIWSLALVFWLSILPQVAALLVSSAFREPARVRSTATSHLVHLGQALSHLARSPRLLWLTLAQSISFGFGEASFQFVSAFYRTLWPLWAIGLLRTAAHALAAAGFWFAGSVIDRFQHFRVLVFSSVYGQSATLVGLVTASSVSPVIMTSPSFLYGVSQTAKNHLLQQNFNDEQRATLGSIVAFAGSIVFGVAAVSMGAIADAFSAHTAMLCALAVQVWIVPIYFLVFRSPDRTD